MRNRLPRGGPAQPEKLQQIRVTPNTEWPGNHGHLDANEDPTGKLDVRNHGEYDYDIPVAKQPMPQITSRQTI